MKQAEDIPARIGYIGLGAMGRELAVRFLPDFPLAVYDLDTRRMAELAESGAAAARNPSELAGTSDVVFLCLPTSEHVEDVLYGAEGIAETLRPGMLVVDQSTGDPDRTRRLAERLEDGGVTLMDAPVSGGPRGAVAGTIAIMVGGPLDAFRRLEPMLRAISPNITHCGNVGTGQVAKLVNNAVAACNRIVTLETIAMGAKYGLPLATMEEIINASSGRNGASERIIRVLLEGGQSSQFAMSLMVKDLNLAADMGHACGAPMTLMNAARGLFQVGINRGHADDNIDVMAEVIADLAGISLRGDAS